MLLPTQTNDIGRDPHQIIIARSNNALGMPLGQPRPDVFSITVYKRVWDGNVTHRFEWNGAPDHIAPNGRVYYSNYTNGVSIIV